MKFLTKLGQLLAQAVPGVSAIGPIVAALIPKSAKAVGVVQDDLAKVAEVVANVEALGQLWGKVGADKAAASAPLVAQVILNSAMLGGHPVANQELFMKGCAEIGGGMADVMNSLKVQG